MPNISNLIRCFKGYFQDNNAYFESKDDHDGSDASFGVLIAGNSLLRQSAAKPLMRKVQRPSRKGVGSSEPKRTATIMVDDMV